MDRLTVHRQFDPPPNASPVGPDDSGSIQIDYDLYQFLIDYSDVEQVKLQSINAS